MDDGFVVERNVSSSSKTYFMEKRENEHRTIIVLIIHISFLRSSCDNIIV